MGWCVMASLGSFTAVLQVKESGHILGQRTLAVRCRSNRGNPATLDISISPLELMQTINELLDLWQDSSYELHSVIFRILNNKTLLTEIDASELVSLPSKNGWD